MTELVPVEVISSKIYLIRGIKVMLDRDLAELYRVETRILNQAVSRNIERFPEDFMFSLTREEIMGISQIVTSSEIKFSKSVRCFTEQGVAMLSSVLRSKRAVQVNIQIMRAFTQLRKMLSTHEDLKRKIESMEEKYDQQFQVIFEAIKQLLSEEDKPKKKIGFTVKEKRKDYGKSAKNKKLTNTKGSFTPKARKIWESIAGDIRVRILNNVWCGHCRKESSIGNLTGKIESGMLVLRGICTKCSEGVARVIENE
jgi:hypothetical protein